MGRRGHRAPLMRVTGGSMISCYRPLLLMSVLAASAHAGPAPFDLVGPVFEVKVIRSGITLPISEVPNLAADDQL
jgi:hypothetical protein